MELRVHGIGDHGALSNQGSGVQLRSAAPVRGVLLYRAPPPPAHEVRFVNWTRTARNRVPLAWYLVLPFTLLNMASFMSPRRGGPLHKSLVIGWGVVLTVTTWLWLVLAAETVIRYLYPATDSLKPGQVAGWVLAGGLCALVLSRALVNMRRDRALVPIAVLHSIAVLAAAAVVLPAAPAALTGPGDDNCWLGDSGPRCIVFAADVTTRFALLSMALAAAIAVLLGLFDLVARDRTWSGTPADPLLGTGLLLVVSTVLLNVGWSAVRLMIDWGLAYVATNLGVLYRADRLQSSEAVLLPWQRGLYGPDMVVGMFTPLVVAVAVLLLGLLLVKLRQRVREWLARRRGTLVAFAQERRAKKRRRAALVHRLVCDSSTGTLAAIVLVAIAVLSAASAAWMSYAPTLNRNEGWLRLPSLAPGSASVDVFRSLTIVSAHLLFLIVALVLIAPSFRKPFAVAGDVIGYWDLSTHPLAGLPYAPDVVAYLKSELRDCLKSPDSVVVLTGHSQGSVLAFTAVRELAAETETETKPEGRLYLVTCGSPLRSLYSRYFPATFDRAARAAVSSAVSEVSAPDGDGHEDHSTLVRGWTNFWRDTDPIACPLFDDPPGANQVDRMLQDPPNPLPQHDRQPLVAALREHSDYWLDEAQIGAVNCMHGEPAPPPQPA